MTVDAPERCWIRGGFAAKHSLNERRRLREFAKAGETGRLGHFRGNSEVHVGCFLLRDEQHQGRIPNVQTYRMRSASAALTAALA